MNSTRILEDRDKPYRFQKKLKMNSAQGGKYQDEKYWTFPKIQYVLVATKGTIL